MRRRSTIPLVLITTIAVSLALLLGCVTLRTPVVPTATDRIAAPTPTTIRVPVLVTPASVPMTPLSVLVSPVPRLPTARPALATPERAASPTRTAVR